MTGAPGGSTESISGEAGNRTCDPWFTSNSVYHMAALRHIGYRRRYSCLWPCFLAVPVLAGGFMVFWIYFQLNLQGSGFEASQKTGERLKVSSDRLGEAGNRICDPWFTRHRFIPTPRRRRYSHFETDQVK